MNDGQIIFYQAIICAWASNPIIYTYTFFAYAYDNF